MNELVATSPLADVHTIPAGDARLTPLPRLRMFEVQATAGIITDEPWVSAPGRVRSHDRGRTLWIGPRRWLVITADDRQQNESPIEASERDGLEVVEVGHGWSGVAIDGDGARELLARGTPLDLRPNRFPPGRCARTWCAGFTILVEARDNGLVAWIDASLAQAFWDWIRDVIQSQEGGT